MFDIDLTTPLTDERRAEVIDAIAKKVISKRLEVPAVLFLDLHKPLSFVASQAMLVGMPFLGAFFGAQAVADASKLLQDRENVEKLIARIEDMSIEQDANSGHAEPDSASSTTGPTGHAELDSASNTDPESSSG